MPGAIRLSLEKASERTPRRENADMASIRSFLRKLRGFIGLDGPAAPTPPAAGAEPGLGASRPAPGPTTQAMPQLVALAGEFPTRGDGGTNAYFTLAMVQTFAGLGPAFGAPRAEGQILQLDNPPSNQALFSVLGLNFGGDGIRTFGLPNLTGRAAIGGQQIGMFGQGTLTMSWLISTGPSTLAPEPGTLAMFGGNYAPDGWAFCDGSTLAVSQWVPLYEAIGTAFGGNAGIDFMLPDLNGAAPVGTGQGPGRAPVALGQRIAGLIAGLGINYLISLEGPAPPSSGAGAFPDTGQYLGQVIAYGGAQVPAGWAPCDGSLWQISANPALFELIGTAYGGDGKSVFALPDLRGLMVTGLAG
jgi:microcystin-dependent protein